MGAGGNPYREVGIDETPYGQGLTIAAITAEVREVNIAKGWRAPDGGLCPGQTFGDYIALAHSELSEALEAYRDHRLVDATAVENCEGPTCDIHGHEPIKPEGVGSEFADLLIRLVDMADVFGIDLEAEYRRKIAYNRTRAFQHGGRTLADPGPVTVLEALTIGIPDDRRDWWTGPEVDAFLRRWDSLGLPELIMQDATGEELTLWTIDLESAARMLGLVVGEVFSDNSVTIKRGEYVVCVVQAQQKETKDA